MSYEVTAARRRPKTFNELAGQEFVATTLKNSLETGRIAHAYLFSGPRGCGKTSAARILARALRCEKGPTSNPCGVCPQCVEMFNGASMDVLEIDGASNTGVNDVRQIKEEVLFSPSTGRYKVYIIDEVHMLSNSAFNALLKTIEEPPPNVIFIFATTELQKVPATIRSRCQQFNFKLIPIETLAALLREVCNDLGFEAEDEALLWIAREATGSCRDAYTLFDQVASFSEGRLRMELIREKLGLVGLDRLNEFAEACAAGDFSASLSLLDASLSVGVAVETFITDLAAYYHSLLLIKAGVSRDTVLGYQPERFSKAVLEKYDAVRLERAGELLYGLYRDIRYSVSPRAELETLVSKLCWLEKWISPAELKGAIVMAQSVLGGSPAFGTRRTASAAEIVDSRIANSSDTAIPLRSEPPADKFDEELPSLKDAFTRHMSAKQKPLDSHAEKEKAEAEKNSDNSRNSIFAESRSDGKGADLNPAGLDPGVKKVLSIFKGTIVEDDQ